MSVENLDGGRGNHARVEKNRREVMAIPSSVGSRVLRQGVPPGPDLDWLQQQLHLEANGEFGTTTRDALVAWQKAHGLDDDGEAGSDTLGAMKAAAGDGAVAAPPAVAIASEVIRKGYPNCADPAAWAAALTAAFARFPKFIALGAACIIAKAEMETGGLTRWDENLSYKTPERLLQMFGQRAVFTRAARDAVAAHAKGTPWPAVALGEATRLVGNPVETGDKVYAVLGGFAARGGGIVQLTGLGNQAAFAMDMKMTLAEGRDFIRTIPGAAMTGPWYIDHVGGTAAANAGDMKEVLRLVAGKRSMAELAAIWAAIDGDKQMAAFQRFKGLLGA